MLKGEGKGRVSRFARIWGQISNAHISKTVRDNPIIMVLKYMENKVALSIEIGFRALGQHISEIVSQNWNLDQEQGNGRKR